MTTLTDRPATALLVIDVQQDVMEGAQDRDSVIGNIAGLVDRARAEDVPVVFVAHADEGMPRDSDAWQYVPELQRADAEPLVHKGYGDSFEDTDLEDVLAARGVGRLVVTGAASDACIRSTLHGALARGYDVTLVADAHTTQDTTEWGNIAPADIIRFTNLYWGFTGAPGRTTAVVPTAEVAFAPQS
ncbi:isochorismatase family protein [Nocardioides aurantiacus]|uniref:Nicotinamidase-related amidase n=1 Tax=Nocardioides aurantiacus TaxID=86796 RepID=A0A3N2CZS6_9ACTN|nr:isochorismatase family protein [Nocardioides aurantiacus]ROR93045.1 nicotinamidase-related amidase [Nocardioides aurantiacus]